MKKKNKTKKEEKIKPKKLKKYNISKEKRITIISLLLLLIVASGYNTFASINTPDTQEQIIKEYDYTQQIEYNYLVYLKNNSLYDKKVLSPGEGVFFKEILDYIEININYDFIGSRNINLDGSYDIDYIIKNNLWEKNYEITKNKEFKTDSNQIEFQKNLNLNITKYDEILTMINEETNTNPQDTNLIIKTTIKINGDANNKKIYDKIYAELKIPLNKNIIEIKDNLLTQKNGTVNIKNIVKNKEIDNQRTIYASSSTGLIVALLFFIFFTKTEINYDKKYEHDLRKIEKKYGEWIIKTKEKPPFQNMKTINLENLDDLIKISEESGVNIIQYQKDESTNEFYIYLDNILYRYNLTK